MTSLFLDSLSLKGDQKPTLEEATRRLKAQSAAAERSPSDRAEGHRDAPCDCPPRGRHICNQACRGDTRTNYPGLSQNVAHRPLTKLQRRTITSTAQDRENIILPLQRNPRESLFWLCYKGPIHGDPSSNFLISISSATSEPCVADSSFSASKTVHQRPTLLRLCFMLR